MMLRTVVITAATPPRGGVARFYTCSPFSRELNRPSSQDFVPQDWEIDQHRAIKFAEQVKLEVNS
jgi:hypothetical protein